MAENEPGLEPLKEDARITSLNERLAQAKSEESIRKGEGRDKGDDDYRLGNRVLSQLVGSLVGGAVIGWTLDRLFGTSPWFLLGMLFLGIVSGFWSIIRISNRRSK